MNLSKDSIRLLRDRINAALAPLGTELSLALTAGNATFNPAGTNATFKLEVAVIGADGQVETKAAADYRALHKVFGLPADGLGRDITFQGKSFKIVGLMPRSDRRPLLGKSPDGKEYKLPVKALVP